MADSYKLTKLRRLVGAKQSEDDLLLMYLTDAERTILGRLYPMTDEYPQAYNDMGEQSPISLFFCRSIYAYH